jgi:hypothetical protein
VNWPDRCCGNASPITFSAAPQAEALTFAAICAHNAGHFHLSAAIITRHDTLVRTCQADGSPLIEVLKLDYRIAAHLATAPTVS